MKTSNWSVLALALVASVNVQAAHHGIFPVRRPSNPSVAPKHAAPEPGKVKYYGGPVISHAKVYSVMWGANVKATTQQKIGDFYAAVLNSTHMDWLDKQYNTLGKAVDGRQGTGQHLGRGNYAGNVVITPANTKTDLDDKEIQAEIEHQIEAGVLPVANADTLYMIYFPPGVSITIEGMKSCQSFCAYHEGFKSTKYGNVFYGVMPDLGGACSFGCGFAVQPFDTVTAISSHELLEAITDPFPTPGSNPAFPQAWNTTDGQEIGDLCAQTRNRLTTKGLTYALQGEWDNEKGVCTTATYQSP